MDKTTIYSNLRSKYFYNKRGSSDIIINIMCPLPEKIEPKIKKEIEDDCNKSIIELKKLKLGDLSVYDSQVKMYEFVIEELKKH